MFRIAVCGGEPHELEWLRSLLDKYIESHNNTDIKAFFFDTGDELLQDIESGGVYDLNILDVLEPSLAGIELAKKIRATGSSVPLVFTASSSEYAIDAFSVYATQYFLKPVSEIKFFTALDIILKIDELSSEIFEFPAPDGTVSIPLSGIEYIEIYDHKITAHLVDGTDMESKTIRTSFADAIAPLLADSRFLQIHRSFAINMEHVQEMVGNSFMMTNGSSIPVSRYKITEARTRYLEWRSQHGIGMPAEKKGKAGEIVRRSATVSLIILLILTTILNLSPKLSAAAYEIPVIGDIVRVLTLNRFEYKDDYRDAEIVVPQIYGLLDPELENQLNTEFREYADEYIRSFEEDILTLVEVGGEDSQMAFKANYVVKTDTDRVLAIDAYIYSEVSGLTIHKFYTIDKRAGVLVTLPGLFASGTNYIAPISAYILSEMIRINDEEAGEFDVGDSQFGSFAEIKPDQSFYINDGGNLVICFDKYEVAAGFMGSPEFVIPSEVISDIVSTDLIR